MPVRLSFKMHKIYCSHCPGWCSESEPELDNTRVSNYPGPILTYKQSVMSMIWLSWVTVVLCGLLVLITVTFLTVWALVVEVIPASLSCQYTSNRNMKFVHTLCCYNNSKSYYLTIVLNKPMLNLTDCPINWFSLPALILEYSLPQSWRE